MFEPTWTWLNFTFGQLFNVIDFQQFLKNKMAATANFLLTLTTTSDKLKETLWIYLHRTFYMDIMWHLKLGWYWFRAIFEGQEYLHFHHWFISILSCSHARGQDSFAVVDNRRFLVIIVSPVRSTYGGYYGLVVVTPPRPPRPRPPRPRPQTLHRSHDNLKNPYRIASIFYM